MPYLGKTPSQATRKRYYKTASAGDTSVSGTMTVGGTLTFNDGEFVDVSVNGVALVAGTDYNTNTANTIAGLSALSANDQVEIVVYDTFSVFGGNVDGDFNLNNGNMTITTADNTAQLTLKSTDADASSGPEMDLIRESASPADDDELGHISFKGQNDAAETVSYAEIDTFLRDASDGTEDGELRLNVRRNGTLREGLSIGADVVFNEGSEDVDVRMESDGNTHMFFLDAGNNRVGIGTNSPSEELHVSGQVMVEGTSPTLYLKETDTTDTNFQIRLTAGVLRFQKNNDAFSSSASVLSLEQGGDVTISDGNLVLASGHGIDFSATSNSAGSTGSELLDDYEEGTWTPTGTASSGSAPTFSSASGTYTKIGRLVTANANITNITVGDTANAIFQVSSLPFTPDQADCFGACNFGHVTISSENGQVAMADASTNRIIFFMNRSDAGRTNIDNQHITSGTSDLQFTVSYMSDQ
tara:strand:+ start:25 stop:1437 length:1413 start_codon:yes stop_codon:yes gene_type:complete